MLRERLSVYRSRVRRALTAAFDGSHSAHEVAASFAIGIFVTAMPTGGLGIGLFFLLAYWFPWLCRTAMFASVVVLNPLVYAGSVKLGAVLLGTDPLVLFDVAALDYAVTVVQLLLLGNVLIALTLSGIGYVVVLELTRSHRRRHRHSRRLIP